jgi:hypothetical protein
MKMNYVYRAGCVCVLLSAVGCGGDEPSSGGKPAAGETKFSGESELFPALDFSTGLVPEGSPVQASFTVSAKGAASVLAAATASGSDDDATLTGLPGRGTLAIDGGFALLGQLKVDLSQIQYDGPIPGLENVEIPVAGSTEYDPFAIDQSVTARADIPASELPPIPLESVGVPGQLVLKITEGSFVELAFTGTCAGIAGETASYSGRIDRGGMLAIQPTVRIDVPVVGGDFDLPAFSVNLALGSSDVAMNAEIDAFAAEAPKGQRVTGSCQAGAETGAGGSATSGDGTGGTGNESAGTGNESGTGDTGGNPVSGCETVPDWEACVICCADAEPDAYYELELGIINACGCSYGAACVDVCQDLCGGGDASDACVECLGSAPDCQDTAFAECNASSSCAPVIDCLQTCP